MMQLPRFESINELARGLGLELVALLDVETARARLSRERSRLTYWQESGFAGEMRYMRRSAELLTEVDHLLPGCRAVLSFVARYSGAQVGLTPVGYGRVARYAWGRDYHPVLKGRVEKLAQRLFCGGVAGQGGAVATYRVFSDAVPLLERALASEGGGGFIGKNGLYIKPGHGSFMFLAELLVVGEVDVADIAEGTRSGATPGTAAERVVGEIRAGGSKRTGAGCKSCVRCQQSCPTAAFVAPYLLDSRRCISYLTIEKKGELSSVEGELLGEWVFGCDVCQEVCPFNHRTLVGWEKSGCCGGKFAPSAGVGPFLSLESVLSTRLDLDFKRVFGGTPLMRAGREQLIRNSCWVAVNRKELGLVSSLRAAVEEDPSPLVRKSARVALEQLVDCSDGVDRVRIRAALSKVEFLDGGSKNLNMY